MKRCSKCNEEKSEDEFYKTLCHKIDEDMNFVTYFRLDKMCKYCKISRNIGYRKTEQGKNNRKATNKKYRNSKNGKRVIKKCAKINYKKNFISISDYYIKYDLHKGNELTDDQLIMIRMRIESKRINRNIRKVIWAKNESNHTDVYGKQCADEKDHEG